MDCLKDRLHSPFSKIGTIVRSHNPSHDLIIRDNLNGLCWEWLIIISCSSLRTNQMGMGGCWCVPLSSFPHKIFRTYDSIMSRRDNYVINREE